MDDLAFLRERIESYADYTNDADSVRSDDQVRAYVGVALAGIFERLEPAGAGAEALARVMLRCQFADQSVVRALDLDGVTGTETAALHAADRDLILLADRAGGIDAAGLAGYVAEIDAAFDRRAAIITAGGAAVPPAPKR